MATIIVVGNLSEGFTFYGPFNDHDQATWYADVALRDRETWIATLERPKLGDEVPTTPAILMESLLDSGAQLHTVLLHNGIPEANDCSEYHPCPWCSDASSAEKYLESIKSRRQDAE